MEEWVIELNEEDPEPVPVMPVLREAPYKEGFVYTGCIGRYDCYEKEERTHIFEKDKCIMVLSGTIYDHVDILCKLSKE